LLNARTILFQNYPRIRLKPTNDTPIRQKQYPLSPEQEIVIEKYVDKLSKAIIVQPSVSPWSRDERELIFHFHSLPFPFVHSHSHSHSHLYSTFIPIPIHHSTTNPIPSHSHSRSLSSKFECDVM
jgi:hypothetical protein